MNKKQIKSIVNKRAKLLEQTPGEKEVSSWSDRNIWTPLEDIVEPSVAALSLGAEPIVGPGTVVGYAAGAFGGGIDLIQALKYAIEGDFDSAAKEAAWGVLGFVPGFENIAAVHDISNATKLLNTYDSATDLTQALPDNEAIKLKDFEYTLKDYNTSPNQAGHDPIGSLKNLFHGDDPKTDKTPVTPPSKNSPVYDGGTYPEVTVTADRKPKLKLPTGTFPTTVENKKLKEGNFMHSENFTKGKRPRILQGEIFTDKDIPPFMTMTEWNKKHNLGDKKWIQEFVEKRSNYLMEQEQTRMKDYTDPASGETYSEPKDWSSLPFSGPEEFRSYYNAEVNPDHDWNNTTHWGPQHQSALDDAMKAKRMEPSEFMTDPNASIQDHGPQALGHGAILGPNNTIIPGPAEDEYITTSKDRPGPPPTLPASYPESTGTPLTINPIDQSYDLFDPNITPNRPEYSGTGALMSWLAGDLADEYIPDLVKGQENWDSEYGPIITKTKVEHPAPDLIDDPDTFFAATDAEAKNKTNVVRPKGNKVRENMRIKEMKKNMKRRINEMVEDELEDTQLGNGRMISGEPKDIKYKVGMEVKDINPNCPHKNSRGIVLKVANGDVTYKVTNIGRHFTPGDELTKSADQLIPLTSKTGHDEDKPWYISEE